MKKLIIITISIFCFCLTKAQGNLQYNRTVFFKIDTSFTISGSVNFTKSYPINVPNNKTLKIESINSSGGNFASFAFEGQTIGTNSSFPIWLPSGSYEFTLRVSSSSGASGTSSPSLILSGLEFNIIP